SHSGFLRGRQAEHRPARIPDAHAVAGCRPRSPRAQRLCGAGLICTGYTFLDLFFCRILAASRVWPAPVLTRSDNRPLGGSGGSVVPRQRYHAIETPGSMIKLALAAGSRFPLLGGDGRVRGNVTNPNAPRSRADSIPPIGGQRLCGRLVALSTLDCLSWSIRPVPSGRELSRVSNSANKS